jgi:hypothetical protein
VFHAALAAYLGNPSGTTDPVSDAPAAISTAEPIATPVPVESQPVEEVVAVSPTAVSPIAQPTVTIAPDSRINVVFIALGVLAFFVLLNFVLLLRIWRKISR